MSNKNIFDNVSANQINSALESLLSKPNEVVVIKFTDVTKAKDRLKFLPSLVKRYLELEVGVFNVADQQMTGYSGGMWNYTRTDNDSGYMWPNTESEVELSSMNGNTVKMSPRAAGIAMTMLVFNHLTWQFAKKDTPAAKQFEDHYFKLREFVWCDDAPFSQDDQSAIYSYLD